MFGLILRSFMGHLLAVALVLPAAALLVDEPPVGSPATNTIGRLKSCVPHACKRPRNQTCVASAPATRR